ncbi:hypothetical protein HK102_012503 [Quaeritorhiza haematococci]|nr:hypothetical protein HK102_012503 [Quaeritorhiza haematococci]
MFNFGTSSWASNLTPLLSSVVGITPTHSKLHHNTTTNQPAPQPPTNTTSTASSTTNPKQLAQFVASVVYFLLSSTSSSSTLPHHHTSSPLNNPAIIPPQQHNIGSTWIPCNGYPSTFPPQPVLSSTHPSTPSTTTTTTTWANPAYQAYSDVKFKAFIETVLAATNMPPSAVIISLKYVYRFKSRTSTTTPRHQTPQQLQSPSQPTPSSSSSPSFSSPCTPPTPTQEYRVWFTSLILADAFTNDNAFTSTSWSEVSGGLFTPLQCAAMKREFLRVVGWDLNVREEVYAEWLQYLEGYLRGSLEQIGAGVGGGAPVVKRPRRQQEQQQVQQNYILVSSTPSSVSSSTTASTAAKTALLTQIHLAMRLHTQANISNLLLHQQQHQQQDQQQQQREQQIAAAQQLLLHHQQQQQQQQQEQMVLQQLQQRIRERQVWAKGMGVTGNSFPMVA